MHSSMSMEKIPPCQCNEMQSQTAYSTQTMSLFTTYMQKNPKKMSYTEKYSRHRFPLFLYRLDFFTETLQREMSQNEL